MDGAVKEAIQAYLQEKFPRFFLQPCSKTNGYDKNDENCMCGENRCGVGSPYCKDGSCRSTPKRPDGFGCSFAYQCESNICDRACLEFHRGGWCKRKGDPKCGDQQDAPKPGQDASGLFPAGAFGLVGGKDGKYCADEGSRTICNRGGLGGWEKFTIEKVGSNKYALKGGKDKKYCADEGEHGVKCNRNAAPDGGWEQFEVEVVDADKNIVAFKGGKDGKFCADEGNMIKCNRGSVGSWEKFTVVAA